MTTLIDIAVGLVIFVVGLGLTVHKFGTQNRVAFTIAAVLTPVVAVFAIFQVVYLVVTGRTKVDPCPSGLDEAERLVEAHRHRMFGGDAREPSLANSWRRIYALELQKDSERVQRVANRYLAAAA
jgi:hypothetical protein